MKRDSRKKIVYVNPCADISGAEVSLLLLLRGLDEEVYDITVIAPEVGTFTEEARFLGASVHTFPMHAMMIEKDLIASIRDGLSAVREIGQIQRLLERLHPDLLHINSYRVGLPFSLAARGMHIPIVWHLRDIPQSGLKKKLLAGLTRYPTHVVAISDAVASSIGGAGRATLTVIHNGVELERYDGLHRGELRREFAFNSETLLFCSVGQLIPWKGQDLLIEAFARVLKSTTQPIHLLIVGSVVKPIWSVSDEYLTYPDKLQKLVHKLELQDHVTFTGFRSDIPEVLQDIDCLVHTPTSPEPFGRVLVEAMAAGKAIIAPNDGGVAEIVDEGVTGLLFEPGSIESLVNAMTFAVEHQDKMRVMGAQGLLRAHEYFSADGHVRKMQRLYQRLLSDPV